MTDYIKMAINLIAGVFVLGGFVIALVGFRDSQTANTTEYDILNDSLNIPSNMTDQFTTIGTLLGVGLLLMIVNKFNQ